MSFDYNCEINRRLSDVIEVALQAAEISGHSMGVDLRGIDIRVYHLTILTSGIWQAICDKWKGILPFFHVLWYNRTINGKSLPPIGS
jgi:hypothetical protein